MDLVHRYFDADTAMWLELDRSYQQDIQSLRPEVIVPAVLHDLFTQTLNDDCEILGVWQDLARLRPLLKEDFSSS